MAGRAQAGTNRPPTAPVLPPIPGLFVSRCSPGHSRAARPLFHLGCTGSTPEGHVLHLCGGSLMAETMKQEDLLPSYRHPAVSLDRFLSKLLAPWHKIS